MNGKDNSWIIYLIAALLLIILGTLIGVMAAVAFTPKQAIETTGYRRLKAVTLTVPASLQETHAEATETAQGTVETTRHLSAETSPCEPVESAETVTPEPTEAPTAEPTQEPTEAPTEATTEAPTEAPTPEPAEEQAQWFWVLATAYSDSLNDTPTGCINDLPLTEEWSIAAVLEHLPYGTLVEIEGIGVRRVEDTASKATINHRLRQIASDYNQCQTWIDIFMTDRQAVDDFGVRPLRIRIVG